MKTLFTSLLLVVGFAALANNGNNNNPGETEKNGSAAKTAVTATARKETASTVKHRPEAKAKPAAQKSTCTTAVDTRFGIGDAFVEFVNESNLKLVKYLLKD